MSFTVCSTTDFDTIPTHEWSRSLGSVETPLFERVTLTTTNTTSSSSSTTISSGVAGEFLTRGTIDPAPLRDDLFRELQVAVGLAWKLLWAKALRLLTPLMQLLETIVEQYPEVTRATERGFCEGVISRLINLRMWLLDRVDSYSLWLELVNTIAPYADDYVVPERFVLPVCVLPDEEYSLSRLAGVNAARQFLQS